MNCEKYYDRRHKGYLIHFVNNKGISKTSLMEMLSIYGPIISVSNRGGTEGLHYVTFKNVEDAIKCIQTLIHNKDIKLLPHKNKNTKGITENSKGRRRDFDNISVTSENTDNNGSITSRSSLKPLLKRVDKMRSNSSLSSEMLDEKSGIEFHENGVPTSTSNKGRELITAQEVIVANIHPNTKIFDIAYLFEDYHPICITSIMQTPNTELTYCHIYFETFEQALSVEKKFDKYTLHGKSLIVLRPQTMIQEALLM
ncbi:uncharacterized protein LOC144474580 [Augochlora pura]